MMLSDVFMTMNFSQWSKSRREIDLLNLTAKQLCDLEKNPVTFVNNPDGKTILIDSFDGLKLTYSVLEKK